MSDVSAKGSRSRNWVFTLNNPGNLHAGNLFVGARYSVYQLERGESGTPHFQGLVCFKNIVTFKSIKKQLPGAHFEIMRGTLKEAEDYCTKEDTRIAGPWRFGERPKQGKRTDLEAVREAINDGAKEIDIANNFFNQYCRYYRAFSRYRTLSLRPRDHFTTALVYWGPTGSGKSYHAKELAGEDSFWLPKPGSGVAAWWDGYDGQSTVVVDEFYGWLPLDMLLRLIDQYPFNVQTRGAAVPFVSSRIIITSNVPPSHWYKRVGHGDTPPALGRRLTEPNGYVFYVGNDKYPTEESYTETLIGVDNGDSAYAPGYRRNNNV